jgi:molecular chaperone DnaK (HSP70)
VQARAALEALGIRVHRLVNQPVAALLALSRPSSAARAIAAARRVAVVSCGGGSVEASIAEREGDGWRVLATAGDNLLGGDDMAWEVAEQLNARIRNNSGVDVFAADESRVAAHGLRAAAEEALRRLAEVHETTLAIDHGGGFGRDIVVAVRRTDIEEWLAPSLAQIGRLCARARGAAPGRIDAVALIGDWAFLPTVRATAAATLNVPLARTLVCDAETAAVAGAAILAADERACVWDVTPYPLGINCYYGEEELLSPIIRANTSIPTPPAGAPGAYTESYQTRFADQTQVRLDVLQYRGARDAQPLGAGKVRPEECEKLGSWEFSGLSPAPGHCAGFTVTFAIDADGILQLEARETATGHTLSARVDRTIG